ncbi:peroxisomal membrane protein 11A [Rutidosis leptorrhynchoides]|uniref:peroxisomal membrane protein 11A n=1 Tax=Rutidosis leptorrhynchoides TaxID=125765 RepID=UPI003A99890A
MEPNSSTNLTSPSPSSTKSKSNPTKKRDFLLHLEAYLAKRDGVDKLLKISRYAAKIILSSDTIPTTHPFHRRLKTFESNVGLSRKAFRLGKFIQDINSFRSAKLDSKHDLVLAIVAYGGEGLYYFVEQLVWLTKSGLIDATYARKLQLISAWAELIGYIGSISLKIRDLKGIVKDEECLVTGIEIRVLRGDGIEIENEKLKKLREKKLMKKLSLVQDVADGLMAVADVRDGKGRLSAPLLLASAGMLSAVISTHKNWLSC